MPNNTNNAPVPVKEKKTDWAVVLVIGLLSVMTLCCVLALLGGTAYTVYTQVLPAVKPAAESGEVAQVEAEKAKVEAERAKAAEEAAKAEAEAKLAKAQAEIEAAKAAAEVAQAEAKKAAEEAADQGRTGQDQGGQQATDPDATHFARLEALDPVFRNQGWQKWLSAAGITWDSISADARQIEEETNPNSSRISAAGLQVKGQNIWVGWPNILTTDRPTEVTKAATTIQYQPDIRNPSVLYTNVWLTGQGTVWIDGQNWGQFTSQLGYVSAPAPVAPTAFPSVATPVPSTPTPAASKSTTGCMTIAELDSRYGIERNAQGANNGLLYDGDTLAGAVLRLNAAQVAELEAQGWTIQGSNPSVKSAWSREACRPLAMQ